MKIIKLPVNPFQMNCYLYYDESSGDCILFDPGVYYDEEKKNLEEIISGNNLKISKIINTHGHLDHVLGNKFSKELTGAPIYFYDEDKYFYDNAVKQGELYGVPIDTPPEPDEKISPGDIVEIGKSKLRVIHTPGHSNGSLSFIDDKNKVIICGDLVFENSIGRTDLPGGDLDILLSSVEKLFSGVEDDYTLLPGHMENTTVENEKKYNPFLTSLYK